MNRSAVPPPVTVVMEAAESWLPRRMGAVESRLAEVVRGLRTYRKDSAAVLEGCREINALENQADSLTRQTVAKLFRRGSDPLSVMKWKEIIDLIESATDRAEDVANVIEGVVLEHA